MKHLWEDLSRGLWRENPTFRIMIGMCPTLAVTTEAVNGVSMGLSAMFVLLCSSTLISALKPVIPNKARIPIYIVIISTFVTIVDYFLKAMFPAIHKVLGIFIPLIVVNCIILGRAEAFAGKNPPLRSALDAVGMGLGFTWALLVLGSIREILGNGTWFGLRVFAPGYVPWIVMILPPGGFLTLGLLLGGMNWLAEKLAFWSAQRVGERRLATAQAAAGEGCCRVPEV
ncbi:MAG: electron transport complex subunit E [Bacillota bacterium]|nr:electron transport complex subunit E [Bacillota bacterium]